MNPEHICANCAKNKDGHCLYFFGIIFPDSNCSHFERGDNQ